MAVLITLDCDAKIQCDYATEKLIFNRILWSQAQHLQTPYGIGRKNFPKKICD
jgi:hypothetical protein